MPLFVCEKCGCVDNTALGWYWPRNHVLFLEGSLPEELVKKPLCSDCVPEKYHDGTPTKTEGWHDRFPKEHWSKSFKKKAHRHILT